MKKSLIALAAVLALFLCGFTARAQTVAKGEYSVQVYARCVRQRDAVTAPVQNGQATVNLGEGTTLTVTGVPRDQGELTLVVYPIPAEHQDAWDWFTACMAPYGDNLYPLELYFENENGDRVELKEAVTVTLQTRRAYDQAIVCRVATDGTVQVLDSQAQEQGISFAWGGGGYCVLAEKAAQPAPTPAPAVTPAPAGGTAGGSATAAPDDTAYYTCPACGYHDWTATDQGYRCDHCGYLESVKQLAGYPNVQGVYEPGTTGSSPAGTAAAAVPQTGDGSRPVVWVCLLGGSALALAALTLYRRKKQQ